MSPRNVNTPITGQSGATPGTDSNSQIATPLPPVVNKQDVRRQIQGQVGSVPGTSVEAALGQVVQEWINDSKNVIYYKNRIVDLSSSGLDQPQLKDVPPIDRPPLIMEGHFDEKGFIINQFIPKKLVNVSEDALYKGDVITKITINGEDLNNSGTDTVEYPIRKPEDLESAYQSIKSLLATKKVKNVTVNAINNSENSDVGLGSEKIITFEPIPESEVQKKREEEERKRAAQNAEANPQGTDQVPSLPTAEATPQPTPTPLPQNKYQERAKKNAEKFSWAQRAGQAVRNFFGFN